MSRIGKQLIKLPSNVQLVLNGQKILIRGPKGSLSYILPSFIFCFLNTKNNVIFLKRLQNNKLSRSLHGLSRTLIANMVEGVSTGFHKKLQIIGVGYRAKVEKESLILNMGYSNPVSIPIPPNLSIQIDNPTSLTVLGIEKDVVNQFAAQIRLVRPPEPYKGKGIKYDGEIINRKVGKTGKKLK